MRFGVLGTVEAWRGDDRLDVGTPRNRAVLARLLLSPGRVIPVDQLIDDLWEGCPPPQALSSLRTFICRLRRVVEPPAQEPGRPSVLITEPSQARLVETRQRGWVDPYAGLAAFDFTRQAP
ncbi:winged helix-turn-helix domain-containing protein, partial [Nonomuraea sp. NPDC055795]